MDQDPGEAILGPRTSGLAAEIALQATGATLHFALLHRQVNFRRAGIARHDVELNPRDFFNQSGEIVAHGAQRRGAAAWMLRRIANIVQRFVRRVGTAINNPQRPLRRSDPGKLRPIKLHFLHLSQLIEIEHRGYTPDRQSIRLGNAVYIVRCRQRTRARHALENDVRLPWNVLAHASSKRSPPEVTDSSRREPEHQPNRLVLVKWRLSTRVIAARENP